LDIALHDLFAQYLGLPLVEYLGRAHEGLPTSVTIGIMPLADTLEAGRQFVAEGFKVIKLKTGKAVGQDVETFSKLRETVGPDIIIRVDANQGYTTDDLAQFVGKTTKLGLEFVEQPLPKGNPREMLELPEDLCRRCAADEDLISPADALTLAQRPLPYGIYNIKLMKCGGVGEALRIADIALNAGIELMWGCNDESIASIAAALHVALACPATRYLDLDGSFDLARDLVTGGFILRDGCLFTNGEPGLGLKEKH
jgi:L-alanine-DL-glutamate epimerase-like enolase superfamily enzyme